MGTKIIAFADHHPQAAYLIEEARVSRQRRLVALSDVRVLVEAFRELSEDPWDEFTWELVERLLPKVEAALTDGVLK